MVMIPGILLAVLLGWNPTTLIKTDYYQNKLVFPVSGTVKMVEDGDTFTLQNGMSVRLIGVDAPNRGETRFEAAKSFLEHEIGNMTVYLEYDRYQDDKYGRILAWVWVDCETTPAILPADYMHLSGNQSRPGLTENPKGCKDWILVYEEFVRSGNGEMVTYTDRGKLKYEERIKKGK